MNKAKYALGQIVYFRLKPEVTGMVTAITFRPNGASYGVTWSSDMTEKNHYECELTDEKSYAYSDSDSA